MPRTLFLALILAALLAPAALLAADPAADTQSEPGSAPVNPRDSKPFPGPVPTQQSQNATGNALTTIKKAAEAQGDISPYTLKALQNDPKALETVNRAPAASAGGQAAPRGNAGAAPRSTKPMYGDIIIHK